MFKMRWKFIIFDVFVFFICVWSDVLMYIKVIIFNVKKVFYFLVVYVGVIKIMNNLY